MKNTSIVKYLGDLRTEAIHQYSKTKIITDAPLDNHGKAEAFSPTDLLATSLASCLLTIVGIAAENHQFSIIGTKAEVCKIMGTEPRRVKEIIIELYFPEEKYSDKQKRIIEQSAKSCPVFQSLHPEMDIKMLFHYK